METCETCKNTIKARVISHGVIIWEDEDGLPFCGHTKRYLLHWPAEQLEPIETIATDVSSWLKELA